MVEVASRVVDEQAPDDSCPETLRFRIDGMDCGSCAESVERAVGNLPGVSRASVNFAAATLTVTLQSETAPVTAIEAAVDRAGFVATPHGAGSREIHDKKPFWRDRRLLPALIGAALWITGTILNRAGAPGFLVTLLFAAAIVSAGRGPARAAWQSLRVRHLDMNVLMISATAGAALLGEWSEGALVVALFSLGGSLQALTIDRTRSAIQLLMSLAPAHATKIDTGREIVVPVDVLQAGDLMRVKPGERIATDGTVVEGQSSLDQRAITGESIPVDALPGTAIFAGSVNGSGSLVVRVTAPAASSTIARIIHLVEEAQASRAPSQELIDRFTRIYTPLVLIGALLVAASGVLITGDLSTWFYRALVLLVIACPCALVISTPVAIVSAIGAATRRGVLIKGGAALEMAGRVRTVAFDKTGTLTTGRPAVKEIVPLDASSVADVLSLAASVEAHSEHPLARAIVAQAHHDAVDILPVTGFQARPGRGATAQAGDRWITIGSARLASEEGALHAGDHLAANVGRMSSSGLTTLVVMTSTGPETESMSVLGLIGIADAPRAGTREALQRLRAAGIEQIVMLTGDSEPVARAIGHSIGIQEVRADLLPADKVGAIRDLQDNYGTVAMVGDGINDAPALATADVGIAMGVGGTGVALETAGLALMGDDLSAIADAMTLARRATRIIRQNIGVSLAVKVLALALGIAGYVDLWVAVLADMGTSLAVTANGLRLLRAQHHDER